MPVPRFQVLDEEGQALRAFWTRAQALAFLLPGYSLRVLPRPSRGSQFEELLERAGESPF